MEALWDTALVWFLQKTQAQQANQIFVVIAPFGQIWLPGL